MDLPLSRAAVPRLEFVASTGSTNDDLRDAATGPEAAGWPHGSVIVTDDQTRGRGRLGRVWLAPTGKTLAISVLLRPELPGGAPFPPEGYGWIPLIAGAAMTEAVRRAVDAAASASRVEPEDDDTGGVEVELKWPNDVLVSGFKVCGILSELLPDTGAVVVGAGLNLTLDEHDLPTITSTSLLLVTGVQPDADAVLADYLGTFLGLLRAFSEHGADAARERDRRPRERTLRHPRHGGAGRAARRSGADRRRRAPRPRRQARRARPEWGAPVCRRGRRHAPAVLMGV